MGGVALLALLAGTSPSAARPRVRAVGTEPLVLLQGDEPTPKDVEPLVPVPEGARARYFRLDAAGFAADLAGAPTGEDGWRDRTSTCRSLAPRDLVLELFDGRTVAVPGLEAERCALEATPVEGIEAEAIGQTTETTSWLGQAKVDGSILVSAAFVVVRTPGEPTVAFGRIDDAQGHHVVQPVDEGGLAVLFDAPDTTIREDGIEELNAGREAEADPGTDVGADVGTGASEDDPGPAGADPAADGVLGGSWLPPENAGAQRTIRIAVVSGNGVSAFQAVMHAAAGANDTNISLANSDLPVRVEIAGSPVRAQFSQTTSMLGALQLFRGNFDGVLDLVHPLRDAREADLAMLILPGSSPGSCAGIAYMANSVEVDPTYGFSVQNVFGCNNTLMSHEVGHNMGSQHDPVSAADPGGLPTDFPFRFSYGHFVASTARDNMGSSALCGSPCPTKPQYADPDIDFVGLPGIRSGTATRRGADSIGLTSWSLSEVYPTTSNDHLWFSWTNRTHASLNVLAGTGADPEAPYTVFGGRFTGGASRLFWYFPDHGPERLWRFSSSNPTVIQPGQQVLDTYIPATGDFDGDGRDDIFWHAPGARPDWMWRGRSSEHSLGTAPGTTSYNVSGWYRPVGGDFDGDGKDDLLWYAPNGQDSIWWGSATSFGSAGTPVAAGAGLIPVAGDFDGDGRDDILWYGQGATADTIWWGQAVRSNVGSPGTTSSRTIVGNYLPSAGDFDGDGRDDVMLYGPGTGSDYVWWGHPVRSTFGSGNQTITAVSGQYATPVAGDYDNNGTDDLYWFAYG
jgi:hypothetical protein